MRREPRTILRDAIAAGDDIVAMLEGMTEAAFVTDRKTRLAKERPLRSSARRSQDLPATFPTSRSGFPTIAE